MRTPFLESSTEFFKCDFSMNFRQNCNHLHSIGVAAQLSQTHISKPVQKQPKFHGSISLEVREKMCFFNLGELQINN